MKAIDFPEANLTLRKPGDMKEEDCHSLRVWAGPIQLVSGDKVPAYIACYQFEEEDINELIANKGRIYVQQIGVGFKPISVYPQNPFGMAVTAPEPPPIIIIP
jgi:hypothetical protein